MSLKYCKEKKRQFPPVTSIVLSGRECKIKNTPPDLHGEGAVTLKACAFLYSICIYVLQQSKSPASKGGPLTLAYLALLGPTGKP